MGELPPFKAPTDIVYGRTTYSCDISKAVYKFDCIRGSVQIAQIKGGLYIDGGTSWYFILYNYLFFPFPIIISFSFCFSSGDILSPGTIKWGKWNGDHFMSSTSWHVAPLVNATDTGKSN